MPYTNGTMKLTDTEGKVVEMPAKFKTRGATAQDYLMKPSLNMKLRTADYTEEADSALLGMRSCSSWILDAMAIDRICMRNRVAFDIWNEFSRLPYETNFDGRNGTEGRFIEVYINDEYYGIYCLSDRINRKLLDLKKVKELDDGTMQVRGVLYKSGTQSILDQNDAGYNEDYTACVVEWHNAWELTFPEDYASPAVWKPLQDAILRGTNVAYIKKYFFLENLADFQLHVMALAIADNWGNKNHFLSVRNINKDINAEDPDDANRRRFVITPWDLDTSLGGNYIGACYNGNYEEFPLEIFYKNAPYPISFLIGNAEYQAILKQRWIEGRKGAFSMKNVNKKLETYRDLFIKSGAWQRMIDRFGVTSSGPMLVADLAKEIGLIEKWYENRFHEMDAYFGITDGIENIEYSPLNTAQAVYNLQGHRMADSTFNILHSTRKGIIILNGNKYFVR
ncbi:MAG: CotH kinase family protein [Bacteroidaceae bacterium]|nr:CotH kinase family protein [Bacteroidaceae bacterium]MBR6891721.1 CotH kinase family protein [Bacteroidaceae bacterium]